ncbi:GntR family transcriptional regulator [Micromonospora sp. CPCC 206061]|uniref:GntR family transcriptional regulator n=1 Tax=Micromonospora sp. CPCC 206061 TaxID=3122410 RepID=UPI002FEE9D59
MDSAQDYKYRRAVAELRRRIEDGAYGPSGELPPAPRLADDLGVTPATARRALAELDREGMTAGRRGRPRMVLRDVGPVATRYERVAEQIRSGIQQGAFAAGTPLPGELELADRFQVARSTVRQALSLLEQAGDIERRSGRRYVPGSAESSDLAYERVASQIRKAIASGKYAAGAKLPGEHKLSSDFSVSRPTIRQALQVLEHDGAVYSLPKQGWYVGTRREE